MIKKYWYFLILFFIIVLAFFYSKRGLVKDTIIESSSKIAEIKETIAPEPTKILTNGLPDKYLIKAAFIEQAPEHNWSQPWQDACEEAALLTVDFYYRNQNPSIDQIKNAILNMIDFEKKLNWGIDINVSQMSFIGTDYLNYKTKILDNPVIEDIQKYVSQNIPVIVPAAGKILFQENRFFNQRGPYYHDIVVLGYDDNKRQFIVHDVGTKHGAYFHYSYNLLMNSIHDFPESNRPEDINNGEKRVLILLK